ncbi:hypothetical protein BD309DRAFT_238466 [Dichomitus squalens]|uniref:Uncharacterized protein n=1 Tax=Dichomitus squalens TaxID=114155 RepID=A0A4Q9Q296_9APHY|nr:hypothetical protein BD309DRAFT_238466 [Dichomitus squalens]TBU61342.1 hypothetical protein BD310DRAFT_220096 [Dichomitus squalens]
MVRDTHDHEPKLNGQIAVAPCAIRVVRALHLQRDSGLACLFEHVSTHGCQSVLPIV